MKKIIIASITLMLATQFAMADGLTRSLQWIQEGIIGYARIKTTELIGHLIESSTDAKTLYRAIGTSQRANPILKDGILVRLAKNSSNEITEFIMISGSEWGANGVRVHIGHITEFEYFQTVYNINTLLYHYSMDLRLYSTAPKKFLELKMIKGPDTMTYFTLKGRNFAVTTYEIAGLHSIDFDRQAVEELLKMIATVKPIGADRLRFF